MRKIFARLVIEISVPSKCRAAMLDSRLKNVLNRGTERFDLVAAKLSGYPQWMDSSLEQGLIGIDISQSRHRSLIQ